MSPWNFAIGIAKFRIYLTGKLGHITKVASAHALDSGERHPNVFRKGVDVTRAIHPFLVKLQCVNRLPYHNHRTPIHTSTSPDMSLGSRRSRATHAQSKTFLQATIRYNCSICTSKLVRVASSGIVTDSVRKVAFPISVVSRAFTWSQLHIPRGKLCKSKTLVLVFSHARATLRQRVASSRNPGR